VDNVGDKTTEAVGEGTDLVKSSVTFTLAANVENLLLTGTGNVNGTGTSLANTITGNTGNNTLNGLNGADTLVGGLGNDTLLGGLANDTLTGGDGDDTLNGEGGIDTASYAGAVSAVTVALVAGAQATGGAGIDTLIGIENLTGSSFNDSLTGDGGVNILTGGIGADTMTGLGGDDTYNVDNVGDSVVEANGGGTDLVKSSVNFSLGGQFIEKLILTGSSNINGTGNTLDNTLTGNSGNNVLNGSTGADTLLGGDGADTLIGGLDRDTMTGGAGADVFDFNAVNETGTTGATRDVIVDFVQGSDKFDLSTIDADSVLAGNQAFTFIGAAAFSGVAGQLRAAGTSATLIHGDVNGDSVIDFSITLTGVYTLVASDFVL
jgi:Ca2+-binding RTX toxin-like protein